jgi:hypothetical protein
MVEYALIIFLYFSSHGGYKSKAITSVIGFKTEKLCKEAGTIAISVENRLEFVCVRTK